MLPAILCEPGAREETPVFTNVRLVGSGVVVDLRRVVAGDQGKTITTLFDEVDGRQVLAAAGRATVPVL